MKLVANLLCIENEGKINNFVQNKGSNKNWSNDIRYYE